MHQGMESVDSAKWVRLTCQPEKKQARSPYHKSNFQFPHLTIPLVCAIILGGLVCGLYTFYFPVK